MSSSNNRLSAAVRSAKEQDLKPLAEESAETLGLDEEQLAELELYLQDAWLFGIRTGHAVMLGTKMGQRDATPVIHGMQGEFQDLMEQLADDLNTTVGTTLAAWDYLGQAWIAGAKFWEIEISARLIESQSGGFDEMLRQLED
ncbi:MAG: hypothetical protein ACJ76B_10965 [Solirubrobacterales bacterium]